ncbi:MULTISPECIES: hypothetical protein [Cupriavidus]|uniref:hypothetical protein n=1 Tax=Cupriavidus sp. DF5525 TaxID=3160989 RepID=UPI0032DF4DED
MRQATVILNALFVGLTEAGYLAGNPLALARRRRAPSQAHISRNLSLGDGQERRRGDTGRGGPGKVAHGPLT